MAQSPNDPIDIAPDQVQPLNWDDIKSVHQVRVGNSESPMASEWKSRNYIPGTQGWMLSSNGEVDGFGSGGVGGSDTQIQFNDGGSIAGDASLTWDNTNEILTIGTGSDVTGTIESDGNLSLATTEGGNVRLQPGDGASAGQDGGDVILTAGVGNTDGTGGDITITAGDSGTIGALESSRAGNITLDAGDASGAGDGTGGFIDIAPGQTSAGTGQDGYVSFSQNGTSMFMRLERINTTDATPTTFSTLIGIDPPSNAVVLVEAHVWARRTGGTSGTTGDGAGYVRRGLYKNVSGTLTLIGSVQDTFTAESQAGWDCTLVISGDYILPQVTGAANNNVRWDCRLMWGQVS